MAKLDEITDEELFDKGMVSVYFLRSFIGNQYRAYVALQVLVVILLTTTSVWAFLTAIRAFTNDLPILGWACVVVVGSVAAVVVGSLVLLVQRGALVRRVMSAPVDRAGE
ncbi:hypothetical protein [Microbacterium sp. 179-I 3D4 NHS]|uniref:hypothetical protein n=1 Tax=Microbacterium sp. 179-I 3D4 NHS TaxID=3142381 RepID=UPI0039A3DC7A